MSIFGYGRLALHPEWFRRRHLLGGFVVDTFWMISLPTYKFFLKGTIIDIIWFLRNSDNIDLKDHENYINSYIINNSIRISEWTIRS